MFNFDPVIVISCCTYMSMIARVDSNYNQTAEHESKQTLLEVMVSVPKSIAAKISAEIFGASLIRRKSDVFRANITKDQTHCSLRMFY